MRDLSLIEEATEHDATLWEDEDPTFDPDYAWLDSLCDSCDGSGYVDANDDPNVRVHAIKRETCPSCGGSGQRADHAGWIGV
jgi:hypothetical protein